MNDYLHYLYRIIRKDGKKYIGVSVDPHKRLAQHVKGRGNRYLKGEVDLILEIIVSGTKEEIYSLERDYILEEQPELNIAEGGSGGFSGNPAIGSNHGRSKLTEKDVLDIRKRINSGEKQKDLSREYKVSPGTIYSIWSNRKWKHVGGPTKKVLNKKTLIEESKRLRAEGLSYQKIADKLSIHRSTVYNYINRKNATFL